MVAGEGRAQAVEEPALVEGELSSDGRFLSRVEVLTGSEGGKGGGHPDRAASREEGGGARWGSAFCGPGWLP